MSPPSLRRLASPRGDGDREAASRRGGAGRCASRPKTRKWLRGGLSWSPPTRDGRHRLVPVPCGILPPLLCLLQPVVTSAELDFQNAVSLLGPGFGHTPFTWCVPAARTHFLTLKKKNPKPKQNKWYFVIESASLIWEPK